MVDLFIAFAQIAGRTDGVAKGAVKGAGVFGTVGHDARVDMALGLQRRAYGANAAVHHVAGGHDVDTGIGLCQGLANQHGHGFVVQDIALGFGPCVGQTVLAMAGKRVQCDVGHDAQLGKFFFQCPHNARHQTVGVAGLHAVVGLQ